MRFFQKRPLDHEFIYSVLRTFSQVRYRSVMSLSLLRNPFTPPEDFKKDVKYINGLSGYEVVMQRNICIEDSKVLKQVNSGSEKVLQFEFQVFQPGSVVVIRLVPRSGENYLIFTVFHSFLFIRLPH